MVCKEFYSERNISHVSKILLEFKICPTKIILIERMNNFICNSNDINICNRVFISNELNISNKKQIKKVNMGDGEININSFDYSELGNWRQNVINTVDNRRLGKVPSWRMGLHERNIDKSNEGLTGRSRVDKIRPVPEHKDAKKIMDNWTRDDFFES